MSFNRKRGCSHTRLSTSAQWDTEEMLSMALVDLAILLKVKYWGWDDSLSMLVKCSVWRSESPGPRKWRQDLGACYPDGLASSVSFRQMRDHGWNRNKTQQGRWHQKNHTHDWLPAPRLSLARTLIYIQTHKYTCIHLTHLHTQKHPCLKCWYKLDRKAHEFQVCLGYRGVKLSLSDLVGP